MIFVVVYGGIAVRLSLLKFRLLLLIQYHHLWRLEVGSVCRICQKYPYYSVLLSFLQVYIFLVCLAVSGNLLTIDIDFRILYAFLPKELLLLGEEWSYLENPLGLSYRINNCIIYFNALNYYDNHQKTGNNWRISFIFKVIVELVPYYLPKFIFWDSAVFLKMAQDLNLKNFQYVNRKDFIPYEKILTWIVSKNTW